MFTNDYKDSFGTTYTSAVYESAQKNNKWSLAYTLLYALSKNGMKYASAKTGKCSVINQTNLTPVCKIDAKTTDDSGYLLITFNQVVLKIGVATNSNAAGLKGAYISGIWVTDTAGNTRGTLCKYESNRNNTVPLASNGHVIYSSYMPGMCGWNNDPAVDEDKFRVQTATFKSAKDKNDILSLSFWGGSTYMGTITIFRAKDYFSSKYKYGFGLHKICGLGNTFVFADGSDCKCSPVFNNVGQFPGKISKTCFFTGIQFAGLIGGINGIYQITDGANTITDLLPGTKITVNGREFQAVAPSLFARTS